MKPYQTTRSTSLKDFLKSLKRVIQILGSRDSTPTPLVIAKNYLCKTIESQEKGEMLNRNKFDHKVQKHWEVIKYASEIYVIEQGLCEDEIKKFKRTLDGGDSSFIGKSINNGHTRARYELYIAALVNLANKVDGRSELRAEAGYKVADYASDIDVKGEMGRKKLIIECKVPESTDSLESCVIKAGKQLQNHCHQLELNINTSALIMAFDGSLIVGDTFRKTLENIDIDCKEKNEKILNELGTLQEKINEISQKEFGGAVTTIMTSINTAYQRGEMPTSLFNTAVHHTPRSKEVMEIFLGFHKIL